MDWIEADTVRDHDGALIRILVVNLAVSLFVGLIAGKFVDWIGSRTELEAPRMDGHFNVLFDDGSKVGLAPGPRYLFFDTEYHVEGDEFEVQEHEGIFIDATEVLAVRVEHVQ